MPHLTEKKKSELSFSDFLALHHPQLASSEIPERYWATLFSKLKHEVYDAGSCFEIQRVEYDGEETSHHEYQVVVIGEDGLDTTDSNHIYLIDHAWTYRYREARSQLENVPGLLDRMAALMQVPSGRGDNSEVLEEVLEEMWRYNQTYNFGNFEMGSDESTPVWYILDEFGSRIQHSDEPSFKAVPFFYVPAQLAFTVIWPLRDLEKADEVTRNYAENITHPDRRRARLLPWKPTDMTDISFTQDQPSEDYFLAYKGAESLPNVEKGFQGMPKDRNVKVHFDIELYKKHLTDPRFEVVETSADADVWWIHGHFKDYRGLSEDESVAFVNQFPNESLLTIKDLLAIVARRKAYKITDSNDLEPGPKWLPTTYNLQIELPKFVSYFQHRESKGLNNLWICKPWNLARSLDTHITDNLHHIVRLPDTGPKVACKYIENPVLFYRENVGQVKFDIRYIVMLASSFPLKLFVYRVFWLRFANRPYSLDHFDEYEKHFTVMNYDEETHLKQVNYDAFIPLFENQYPDYGWANIESEIFVIFKELFEDAVSEPYPRGIPPSPQSRAMYAIDLMLKWDKNDKDEKVMQPMLLEVNCGPDCVRACKYHPNFINDVFSALFMDDITDRPVTLL